MAVCGGSGSSEGEELLGEGPLCPPSTGLALPAEPGDVALVPEVLSDVPGGEWLLLGPGLSSPDVLGKSLVGEWWFSGRFWGGSGSSDGEGEELLAEGPSCPPSTGLALLAEPGDVALVPIVLPDVLGGGLLQLGPGLASPDVLGKIFVGEWWFSSWFCDVEGGGGSETSGGELSVP